MSMELWIFSDKKLDSIAQWQAAIDVEGYPLRLSAEASEARDTARRMYEAPEFHVKSVVDNLMPSLEHELPKAEEILRQMKRS